MCVELWEEYRCGHNSERELFRCPKALEKEDKRSGFAKVFKEKPICSTVGGETRALKEDCPRCQKKDKKDKKDRKDEDKSRSRRGTVHHVDADAARPREDKQRDRRASVYQHDGDKQRDRRASVYQHDGDKHDKHRSRRATMHQDDDYMHPKDPKGEHGARRASVFVRQGDVRNYPAVHHQDEDKHRSRRATVYQDPSYNQRVAEELARAAANAAKLEADQRKADERARTAAKLESASSRAFKREGRILRPIENKAPPRLHERPFLNPPPREGFEFNAETRTKTAAATTMRAPPSLKERAPLNSGSGPRGAFEFEAETRTARASVHARPPPPLSQRAPLGTGSGSGSRYQADDNGLNFSKPPKTSDRYYQPPPKELKPNYEGRSEKRGLFSRDTDSFVCADAKKIESKARPEARKSIGKGRLW